MTEVESLKRLLKSERELCKSRGKRIEILGMLLKEAGECDRFDKWVAFSFFMLGVGFTLLAVIQN